MDLMRRFTLTGVLLAVFCLLLASPAFAWQSITPKSENEPLTTIVSDRVINDDLLIAGNDINIDGTVNGDLLVFGRNVTINGTINGDVVAFCSDLIINGKVSEDVRAGAQNILLSGQVGEGFTAGANQIYLQKTGNIGGNVTLGSEKSTVLCPVQGSVHSYSGTLIINNTVGKNVTSFTEKLEIGPETIIGGKLVYTSAINADISNSAKISGGISHRLPPKPEKAETEKTSPCSDAIWFVVSLISNLLIWFIWRLISEDSFDRFERQLMNSGWSTVAWGMLMFFIVPIAGFFLLVTVVGIPLTIIAFIAYGLAMYVGKILVGSWLGHLAAQKYQKPIFVNNPSLAPILGITAIMLLGTVPILGFWVRWLVGVMGLGCAFLYIRDLIDARKTAV